MTESFFLSSSLVNFPELDDAAGVRIDLIEVD